MRMSCNGCRALRKGCNDDCCIRPCLQWIPHPQAQANATVFLAKFYGRAGLLNLINAGPHHLRPMIFRSLLHEACGRIVNPLYGSVGLLWSGRWDLCQAAVMDVLRGSPITRIPTAGAALVSPPPVAYDIRHCKTRSGESRKRFKKSTAMADLSGYQKHASSGESSVSVADASNSRAEDLPKRDEDHHSVSSLISHGEASNNLNISRIAEDELVFPLDLNV